MKFKKILVIGGGLISLISCSSPYGPDYGTDFSTPEFFLARLNPNWTQISIDTHDFTIADSSLEIRDFIFKYDDFNAIEERKSSSDHYFTYSTVIEETSKMKSAKLSIYCDGLVVIDYKESFIDNREFYFELDLSKAIIIYDFVNLKFSTNAI